ncbi:HEXXH motif domain-containing protein [Rathayibacter toxicus]|uniref:HEXXH motif domain-containing protein n=1 Tax=Rathayibacter toxicus TaxID=145458 RepID=A0A0C5B7Y1_9MICO|nr:HEXXH motif-containing putative peptide modification protein [Rathayibacter toxicus]AJM76868.1 hypothetical protein TI83_00535 [Rathayibacter toxicus]ALS57366.1 hypothetical protein APU90_05945 [Rathayibacter toxicus]KKM45668.1 hypothetical protein VT73_05760 [Rathayibacter toxicus]PPG24756.1 HEXXH motif domain-containing protein [Rathayibacter toxicus]PPG48210.1 HEXXH motif domain-containing protein [Rathayibacter toxicus]
MGSLTEQPSRPSITSDESRSLALADGSIDLVKAYYLERLAAGIDGGLRVASTRAGADGRTRIEMVRNAFEQLSLEEQLAAVDHPMVHFMWLKLMESVRDGSSDDVDVLLSDLGRLFAAACLSSTNCSAFALPVVVRNGELRLIGANRVLLLPELDGVGTISSSGGGEFTIQAGASVHRFPASDLFIGDSRDLGLSSIPVPGLDDRIEIISIDPLLIDLFGSMNSKPHDADAPIYDLTCESHVSKETVDGFERAMALITEVYPGMAREIVSYTKVIVPFRSQHISTFAENATMGAIFMSEAHKPFSDVLFAAEHIIHEHSHLRMALIMEIDPIFEVREGALFDSPWRKDPRPLLGIVQGAFVFARIARFLNYAVQATGHASFADRRAQVLIELAEAVALLADAEGVAHTALGQALIEEYRAEIATTTAPVAA